MLNKKATVREVISVWEKGGIPALKFFLNEVIVFEDTWVYKIKKLIEKDHIKSVDEEIKLIAFNLDLKNKLYNNKKTKREHPKNS